jgi:site-specific DNA recombinase
MATEGWCIVIKAVIYTRVSTEEQIHGYSLENQRDKCIGKAKELGALDTIVFEEAGVSGEVKDRPALLDAIAALHRDKNCKYFICTDPDRLSRQLSNLLVFTGQIEKNDVQLIFTDFTRESTPEGELFYSMRGAIAQFEKEMIKRRTTSGKIKKAKEHKWTHWPDIYGYSYNEGEVTINDYESNVVRMIFNHGASVGVAAINDRLVQMGIESPRGSKVWSNTTIRRILNNDSYYTGKTYIRKFDSSGVHLNKYKSEDEKIRRKIRPREEWVEMELPTIITAEDYEAAQRRLINARRKYTGEKKVEFLLSGLLRCAVCGKTWHGFSNKRNGNPKRVTYYVCTYKSPGPKRGTNKPKCPTNFVKTDTFDSAIWETVRDWLIDDSSIDAFHAQRNPKSESAEELPELSVLQNRYEQLNKEEDAMIERLAKETNPRVRQKLGERLDLISSQLDEIQKLIEELTDARQELATTKINREAVSQLRASYPHPDKMTFEQKYDAIHRLVKEITVRLENGEYWLEIYPLS